MIRRDGARVKRQWVLVLVIIAAVFLLVFGILEFGLSRKGAVIGTVADALSGAPVYKARIAVGGRSTIRYVDKNFRITGLDPGVYTLKVSAPGYEPMKKEIIVKRGATRVDMLMRGSEIPGLDDILVFTDSIESRGIQLEIRFVNRRGVGIKHFPKLPMTMDARLYARLGTGEEYSRGRLIYSGPAELYWDPEASLGKNKGIIYKDRLAVDPGTDGRYGVLDVVLHTPQGDYRDTRADVLLEW